MDDATPDDIYSAIHREQLMIKEMVIVFAFKISKNLSLKRVRATHPEDQIVSILEG